MKKVWIILLSLIAMMLSVANAETEIKTPLVIWLEGEEYEMPCMLSELLNDGWVLHERNSTSGEYNEVDVKHYLFGVDVRGEYALIRNGKFIEIELKNEYPMTVGLDRCMIVMFRVRDTMSNPADMSYEGLRFGRTKRTNLPQWAKLVVNSVYINDVESEENYEYKVFADWYNSETLNNLKIAAEHTDYTQAVWDEVEANELYRPASFDDYIEPDKLDKDWSSGMILLDGELYQLPTPIEQFIQDGWVVEEQWVLPGEKVEGRMVKGKNTVQVYAHNIMKDNKEKIGQPAKLSNCEADGIASIDEVYMRAGRFEIGMSESAMKMIGRLTAGWRMECIEKSRAMRKENGERKYGEYRRYRLSDTDSKVGGDHYGTYKLIIHTFEGVVVGMEATY